MSWRQCCKQFLNALIKNRDLVNTLLTSDEDHFRTVSLVMWINRIVFTGLLTNHMKFPCIVRKRLWGVHLLVALLVPVWKCGGSYSNFECREIQNHTGTIPAKYQLDFLCFRQDETTVQTAQISELVLRVIFPGRLFSSFGDITLIFAHLIS